MKQGSEWVSILSSTYQLLVTGRPQRAEHLRAVRPAALPLTQSWWELGQLEKIKPSYRWGNWVPAPTARDSGEHSGALTLTTHSFHHIYPDEIQSQWWHRMERKGHPIWQLTLNLGIFPQDSSHFRKTCIMIANTLIFAMGILYVLSHLIPQRPMIWVLLLLILFF